MAHILGEAHRRGQPHKVLHLTSYDRLEEYRPAFAQGHFNLLILVGAGRLSRRCGITCGPGTQGGRHGLDRGPGGRGREPAGPAAAELLASDAYGSTAAQVKAFVEQGEDAGRPSSTTAETWRRLKERASHDVPI